MMRRAMGLLLIGIFSCGILMAAEVKTSNGMVSGKMLTREGQASTAKKDTKPVKKSFSLPDVSEEDEKAEGKVKNLRGTISARNAYGMGVEYEYDPAENATKEMWVNFTSKLKLNGFQKLSELESGDTVVVIFKETDKGKKILKGITLVQKKPAEAPVADEPQAVLPEAAS